MIIRKGRLLKEEHYQLGLPDPSYDNTDIPLIVTKGLEEDSIEVSDCFLGLQYRDGGLTVKSLEINNVVNDCFSGWTGNINIDILHGSHELPLYYSRSNHADVFQVFSMNHKTFKRHESPVKNIRIKKVDFNIKGEDKGIFMFTGTSGYKNIKLFEDGIDINFKGKSTSNLFINSISFENSELGSAVNPIDSDRVSGLGIRIKGVKPNSPKSYNNTIHCYEGLSIELGEQVKESTTIVTYKKEWSEQERLDHWSIWKDIINLGIK